MQVAPMLTVVLCGILLDITESARGQNGANPVFWVATRASCSLGIFSVGPARKSYLFHDIINPLLTEICWILASVIFAYLLSSSSSRFIKKVHTYTKKSVVNIQTSWPHAWSKTHICRTSITLSPCCEISELSGKFPRVARFCCCRFSPSVVSLMCKAAFARDLSYLAPKGLTIAPH